MNDQELVQFGEQFKHLSDGTMDLVYFPDSGEFELVPKREINNGEIIIESNPDPIWE